MQRKDASGADLPRDFCGWVVARVIEKSGQGLMIIVRTT